MCRFLMYLGPPIIVSDLVTEPENSLIHQSYHSEEREEPLNGDGFGLAWYVHDLSAHPGVFRSISPAWSNRNLHHLARITRSPCVLAHVRAASDGSSVAEANCHPFSLGPFAFMHNGELAGFRTLRRQLNDILTDSSYSHIEGSTDSEFLFAYFLDRWHDSSDITDPLKRLTAALRRTIYELVEFSDKHGVRDKSYLNLAVSDGHVAVASRFTTDTPDNAESLHLHQGKMYQCENGVCRMLDPGANRGSVIISSEKLTEDFGWETVPANHLIAVRDERTTFIEAI